jgi:6-pyruvoyltetrahydropterin/6-carboxytetrahydropterin synthase
VESHPGRPTRYRPPVKHRILIAREQYKFSCAHMTVFPDGTKERLHGHNYAIAVALELSRIDLEAMLPFRAIKNVLGELCAAWKEYVIIAQHNPHLVIVRDDTELEFTLCKERYVIPRGDILLLPIENVTVEGLAAHVTEILGPKIAALSPHVTSLEVTVSEHPGQGASCTMELRR